jgi:hypothetical protein
LTIQALYKTEEPRTSDSSVMDAKTPGAMRWHARDSARSIVEKWMRLLGVGADAIVHTIRVLSPRAGTNQSGGPPVAGVPTVVCETPGCQSHADWRFGTHALCDACAWAIAEAGGV